MDDGIFPVAGFVGSGIRDVLLPGSRRTKRTRVESTTSTQHGIRSMGEGIEAAAGKAGTREEHRQTMIRDIVQEGAMTRGIKFLANLKDEEGARENGEGASGNEEATMQRRRQRRQQRS